MNLNFINSQPKTRLLIIALGLFLGLTFLIILSISLFNSSASTPDKQLQPKSGIPIQVQNLDPKQEITFTNYLEAIVGETTDEQVSKFSNLNKKEALPDGRIAYYFPSSDPLRDNKIETKDGKVIYKRVVAITSSDYQLGRYTPYFEQYGRADQEFTGSGRYGPMYKTFIYANRGFAFIVSPENDAVYEIQSFIPVSVEQYLKNWGQDIREAREQEFRRSEQQNFNEGALE